jgi:EAL domain-containing protein (putative c-di-GMP-specific phosphodiesterase class I)
MTRQDVTALIGLAVFPLLAVAAAAYLVAVNTLEIAAIAGAILVLAAGLFALAVIAVLNSVRHEKRLSSHHGRLRGLADRADIVAARLADLEDKAIRPGSRLDEIVADVKSLRDDLRTALGSRQPISSFVPPSQPLSPPEAVRDGGEHLELLLEPIVELATGVTAHYRALLDLTDERGHAVRHAELMDKADRGGMRPALDAHMVKLVAPVLRRLRSRNPGLRAFVPLGVSTLGNHDDTSRVVGNLERDVDVAGGIVFEFDHRGLGHLDTYGIENLARLGRLGATMALSNVQVTGLDLASLRQLGVRYLSFSPNAAGFGSAPSAPWREFVQYARAMQFQIVVSGIETPHQANTASQIGRYGYGPFFAPPRKVRADAGLGASPRRASAA